MAFVIVIFSFIKGDLTRDVTDELGLLAGGENDIKMIIRTEPWIRKS